MQHDEKVVIDLSATNMVLVNIGEGKTAKVPKHFTVESKINDTPVNVLISFPVKDVQGRTYDARTLLLGQDNQTGNSIPDKLEFDHELATEIQIYFRQNIAAADRPSTAFVSLVLNEPRGVRHPKEQEAYDITTLAQLMDVEIKHANRGNLPSIAIPKNPKWGPTHRKGLFSSALNLCSMRTFAPILTGINPTVGDCILVPLLGYLTSRTVHPPAPSIRTKLTSMNHVSVPTVLLYTASNVAAFAANWGVQTVTANAMSAAGVAGAATTTVSCLLPVALGVSAVVAYQYGPAIGTAIKNKATQAATSLSNCFTGIGNSLKSCSLWARPNRPAAAGAGAGAAPPAQEAGVPLLPSPAH